MRLLPGPRLGLLLLLLSLTLTPDPARADGFEIRLVYNDGATFGLDFEGAVGGAQLRDGRVAFVRGSFRPAYRILEGSEVRTVVDAADAAPNGDDYLRVDPFTFDGKTLAFGAVTTPGPRGYFYLDDGSGLQALWESGDVVPGLDEPLTFARNPWAEDGAITFEAGGGIYRFEDGAFEQVVASPAPVPGQDDLIAPTSPVTHRGVTAFGYGSSSFDVPSGIYRLVDGTIEPLVTAQTSSPSGVPFGRFTATDVLPGTFALHNRDVAFIAPEPTAIGGVWRVRDSVLERIVEGGGQTIALGRRKMVVGSLIEGVIAWEEGAPAQFVVQTGETLGGATVVGVDVSPAALEDDRFVFSALTLDGFDFRSAIYEARFLADCEDGIDNDGDGATDHPEDPGCGGPQDNSERVRVGVQIPGFGWRYGHGSGPVRAVIFGSDELVVEHVDAGSLEFGPAEARPLLDLSHPLLRWLALRDVDRDGHLDLVATFSVAESALREAKERACLNGRIDGEPFEACDALPISHACRYGHGWQAAFAPLLLAGVRRRRLGSG